MILLQFFALLCLVAALTVIGVIVNVAVNFLYLRRKLTQGAKRKFGTRQGGKNAASGSASGGAKGPTQSAAGRKKIIPDDEGEYVDFVEI